MPDSKNLNIPNIEITLTFSARELSQLEAFAALHGESVAAFVQRVTLDAANITSPQKSAENRVDDPGSLWLSDRVADAPAPFAPVDAPEKPEIVAPVPVAGAPKRGVAGERSQLAHGHGLVWEIRRALARERVHGLGWTREQLAFVLKLSVVGVRKMEHLGTAPVKSIESRQALLGLARTLEKPGEEIAAYIEREELALGE